MSRLLESASAAYCKNTRSRRPHSGLH